MMDHPTDCICISCAPISLPTKSPTLNHLLAGRPDCALAHALALAHQLRVRQINQAMLFMRCGAGLQAGAKQP
jgi:hypothetical protein